MRPDSRDPENILVDSVLDMEQDFSNAEKYLPKYQQFSRTSTNPSSDSSSPVPPLKSSPALPKMAAIHTNFNEWKRYYSQQNIEPSNATLPNSSLQNTNTDPSNFILQNSCTDPNLSVQCNTDPFGQFRISNTQCDPSNASPVHCQNLGMMAPQEHYWPALSNTPPPECMYSQSGMMAQRSLQTHRNPAAEKYLPKYQQFSRTSTNPSSDSSSPVPPLKSSPALPKMAAIHTNFNEWKRYYSQQNIEPSNATLPNSSLQNTNTDPSNFILQNSCTDPNLSVQCNTDPFGQFRISNTQCDPSNASPVHCQNLGMMAPQEHYWPALSNTPPPECMYSQSGMMAQRSLQTHRNPAAEKYLPKYQQFSRTSTNPSSDSSSPVPPLKSSPALPKMAAIHTNFNEWKRYYSQQNIEPSNATLPNSSLQNTNTDPSNFILQNSCTDPNLSVQCNTDPFGQFRISNTQCDPSNASPVHCQNLGMMAPQEHYWPALSNTPPPECMYSQSGMMAQRSLQTHRNPAGQTNGQRNMNSDQNPFLGSYQNPPTMHPNERNLLLTASQSAWPAASSSAQISQNYNQSLWLQPQAQPCLSLQIQSNNISSSSSPSFKAPSPPLASSPQQISEPHPLQSYPPHYNHHRHRAPIAAHSVSQPTTLSSPVKPNLQSWSSMPKSYAVDSMYRSNMSPNSTSTSSSRTPPPLYPPPSPNVSRKAYFLQQNSTIKQSRMTSQTSNAHYSYPMGCWNLPQQAKPRETAATSKLYSLLSLKTTAPKLNDVKPNEIRPKLLANPVSVLMLPDLEGQYENVAGSSSLPVTERLSGSRSINANWTAKQVKPKMAAKHQNLGMREDDGDGVMASSLSELRYLLEVKEHNKRGKNRGGLVELLLQNPYMIKEVSQQSESENQSCSGATSLLTTLMSL